MFSARMRMFMYITILSGLILPTFARQESLFTSSVTYCAPPQAILIQKFDVAYFKHNSSVVLNITAASVEPDLNVTANIVLNAYGMRPINFTFNFCDVLNGALCPLPQYNFSGGGTVPIPPDLVFEIPDIAYKVPDLEAFAQLTLRRLENGVPVPDDSPNAIAACVQSTLSNGWSTRQPGVSYSTAILALLALLSSFVHSTLPNSSSAAPYRVLDVVGLFQTIASTALLRLNYPVVYTSFAINFAWALGLFSDSDAIQKAIDNMRRKTGSSVSGIISAIEFTNRRLSPYNSAISNLSAVPADLLSHARSLPVISLDDPKIIHVTSRMFSKRASNTVATVTDSESDALPAGIPIYASNLGISAVNAFMSVFFTWIIGFAVALACVAIVYILLLVASKRSTWAKRTHSEYRWILYHNGLRIIMLTFFPIAIFAFFQWTIRDSWLAVLFSVLLFLLTLSILIYTSTRTLLTARRETPSTLYYSPSIRTIGALYVLYRVQRYYAFLVPLAAIFLKSIFIAFAKSNGLVQVIALLVIEFMHLAFLLVARPHHTRSGDVFSVFLAVMRILGTGLLIAFVESIGVKPIPRVVIGLVILVVFGVTTIVIFVNTLVNLFPGKPKDAPDAAQDGSSMAEKGQGEKADDALRADGSRSDTSSTASRPLVAKTDDSSMESQLTPPPAHSDSASLSDKQRQLS